MRAGRGDREAEAALRRQLEPQLVRIVRSTLRTGRGANPLAQRVLAEARAITAEPHRTGSETPEYVVYQVARRHCATVAAGLARAAHTQRLLLDTAASA